eukprot:GHVT01001339.1.p1 GENE.GHVT01001339.1~~GHVT01001339.1.p1  ORF type:complete len:386 (+),score=55.61 GHVT01001339.1:1350-2507(+)
MCRCSSASCELLRVLRATFQFEHLLDFEAISSSASSSDKVDVLASHAPLQSVGKGIEESASPGPSASVEKGRRKGHAAQGVPSVAAAWEEGEAHNPSLTEVDDEYENIDDGDERGLNDSSSSTVESGPEYSGFVVASVSSSTPCVLTSHVTSATSHLERPLSQALSYEEGPSSSFASNVPAAKDGRLQSEANPVDGATSLDSTCSSCCASVSSSVGILTGHVTGIVRALNYRLVPQLSFSASGRQQLRRALQQAAEVKRKNYHALVWVEALPTPEQMREARRSGTGPLEIKQRTPIRVAHRRANIVRPRTIYTFDISVASAHLLVVKIEAQAGTYIKEFIHGDAGRTRPSLFDLLPSALDIDILLLDVANVKLTDDDDEGDACVG